MLIQDYQTVVDFMFAGKAMITIVSKKTGEKITYKIKKSVPSERYPECYWVSARIAHKFERLGKINHNGYFESTYATIPMRDTVEFMAFQWLTKQLKKKVLPENAEIWHENTCGRCARALSDPISIQTGIGPECRKKLKRFICE